MDDKIRKCCPNCSQIFQFKTLSPVPKGNIPLFLKCGHSMCDNCVKNIIKFQEPIECKICHQEMELSHEESAIIQMDKLKLYELFPINIHMLGEITLQLIEDSVNSSNKHHEECYINLHTLFKSIDKNKELCMECHSPTTKMCKQCATILCETCFNKSHKNFIIFKNHVFQNIDVPAETCKTHQGKSLDYYCKDCLKSICMDCLMVGGDKSCKNHNVASMQEVNDSFLEELTEVAPKVDETFRRLTKTALDVGQNLYNIEYNTGPTSELTQMLTKIEQDFSKLFSIIQKHKKEVIDMITKVKCSEKESLKKAKSEIEEALKKAKKVINLITVISKPGSKGQANLALLLDDAKEVLTLPWYLSKNDSNKDSLKVTVSEDLCALISDYVHLEGNADSVYQLRSAAELGEDVEIPPAPPLPVYPPELPKDVRQSSKPKPREKDSKPTFHKAVPTYRARSESVNSLTSVDSNSSARSHATRGSTAQKPVVQQVMPFEESQHPKQLREGSQEVIYISHIVDPHNFFVQRACHQGQVKDLLREFRNAISLPRPSVGHIAEGKTYLAFNKTDNMWQRCRIVSINRSAIDYPVFSVFYIDFGSTEYVTTDRLRLLPPARANSPPAIAINCSLANCEPRAGAWTADDAFLIQNIIDNKQAIVNVRHVRSAGNYAVRLECDLTTLDNAVSVAHALTFHGRALMPNPRLEYTFANSMLSQQPKIYMNNDDYKRNTMEEVYITFVVSPDKFFVRKRHLQSTFEKICEELEEEYSLGVNTGTIYLPYVGLACVVNIEKWVRESGSELPCAWARGVVLESPGRGLLRVLLVDVGAAPLVHWTVLRYIHKRFTTSKALVAECHLAGLVPYKKKWSPASVALLQKFQEHVLELRVEDTSNRQSVAVCVYDKTEGEPAVCVNEEMIKYKFAVAHGLHNFNQTADDTKNQVITNRSPLQRKPAPANKPNKIRILAKNEPLPTENKPAAEGELNAIDKGPLRLEVKLLNYQTPSLIYISLLHQQKVFNELFEKLQLYYEKNAKSGKKDWKVEDRCCTLCRQSKTWRRAVILEIDGDKAKVFYSDFACVETVPVEELCPLAPEFAAIGDAAIKCHLAGVVPAVRDEWPSISKEFFKELLDAYKRLFITKSGNFKDKSMPVEFWAYHTVQGGALEPNTSEWRCLNKKLVEQGLGVPEKSESPLNEPTGSDDTLSFLNVTGSVRDWLHLEPLPMKPLRLEPLPGAGQSKSDSDANDIGADDVPPRDNVVFISDWTPPEDFSATEFTAMPTYIDNNGVIYLHEASQQDTLDLIRKALDVRFPSFDAKAKFMSWTVGEPCVALYFLDNRFYRGRVLQVDRENKTCLIQYIDYGNEEICPFDGLRKSIVLHQIPIQAHRCSLARVRPADGHWARHTLDYIHKSIVEKMCYIKVVGEPVNGVTPIDLKFDKLWINDHLVEFEMADYTDGSRAVVRRYAAAPAPAPPPHDPDYIVEDDDSDDEPTDDDAVDDDTELAGKDWNQIIMEEENEIKFATFPRPVAGEFLCTVSVIDAPDRLQLVLAPEPADGTEEEAAAELERLSERLQAVAPSLPPIDGVFAHKACVAAFPEDGRWYRAAVLQYSEQRRLVKVRYVDYGNAYVVPLEDVREIGAELSATPPLTVSAELRGVRLAGGAGVAGAAALGAALLDKPPFRAVVSGAPAAGPLQVDLLAADGRPVYEELLESGVLVRTED